MPIFLATTPIQELKGQLEVALIAGKHIFGTNGGRVAGAVICLGLVSAISSMTWIGPRVSMSMGEDHWLLRLLGRKNPHGIPTNAIVLQLLIVNVLLLTGSFESVVQYTQFSLLLCSLFTVVGVIVLRATRPEIARPYRVWAYPLPPIIFAAITLWMMFYLLRSKPIESLAGLATALVDCCSTFAHENARNARMKRNSRRHFVCRIDAVSAHSKRDRRKLRTRFGRAVTAVWQIFVTCSAFRHRESQSRRARFRWLHTAGPNDIARFLAGMPVPENSPLAPLTRDPAWQEHAAFFEKEFTKLYSSVSSKSCTRGRSHYSSRGNAADLRSHFICSVARTFSTSINFSRTLRCTSFAERNRWGRRLIRCASRISPARWEIWKTR